MRFAQVCLSLLLLTSAWGCASTRGQLAGASLSNRDADELVGSSTDPWVSAAAEQGRAGQHRESEPDPLHIRDFFTSPEARDIERNLGID
ncbi:MAG: hypothetical protein ACK5Q5_22100 [Planctomycetaceae bacterium]